MVCELAAGRGTVVSRGLTLAFLIPPTPQRLNKLWNWRGLTRFFVTLGPSPIACRAPADTGLSRKTVSSNKPIHDNNHRIDRVKCQKSGSRIEHHVK
jgi:hypothetical protein